MSSHDLATELFGGFGIIEEFWKDVWTSLYYFSSMIEDESLMIAPEADVYRIREEMDLFKATFGKDAQLIFFLR